jgi:Fanconi-associated nuclease 1
MADALGRLKRHAEEDDLLTELLKQTRWRRGRRGGWWERKMTLATQAQYKNPAGWQRALDIAEAALRDPDTRLGEF